MSLRQDLGHGVGSLEAVRAGLGMPRPTSLRDLLGRYAAPIEFDEPLLTPADVALGGHHHVRLDRSGQFRHDGHARATGFPSFDYSVRTVIGQEFGAPAVLAAKGRVHGTNEFGDRESAWDKSGHNPLITLHWLALKRSRPVTEFNRDSDIFGDVGDVLSFAASLAAGALIAGPAGAALMLGVEAIDAAGIDEHLGVGGIAGLGVAAGVLVIFGPAAIVPALVAGAAAGAGVDQLVRHRPMTGPEVAFADRVFGGTLPVDRIRLTNMLGLGGRPFCMPSIGDTILVNLGDGFDDPIRYTGMGDPDNPNRQGAGQLFIHELTHAWQIENATFLPGLICSAIVNQATTLSGDMAIYQYGPAESAFSTFNLEQQASIVDDWFAGSGRQAGDPESEANPYFRYIRDNIRVGIT